MIAGFRELLSDGPAVGAFTCYDVTTALGVMQAARLRDASTILLVLESSFRADAGPLLVRALEAVAEGARAPCCVKLDHTADVGLAAAAREAGVNAVMADGSRLPTRENRDLVRSVVALDPGLGVEAELGHVEGSEDIAAAAIAGQLTDPDEADAFVSASKPDCLAVSIGNVHGNYAAYPALDWERLRSVKARVDVPLSLHGASGLRDEDVRGAIALGVRKVNVNTEIRRRYIEELEQRLPEARAGSRLLDLQRALIDAVAGVVESKLKLLGAVA